MSTVIVYRVGTGEVLKHFKSPSCSFLCLTQQIEEALGMVYGRDFTVTVY